MLWRRRRSQRSGSERAEPNWEVHIPISPTPAFLLRVRLLVASLNQFSGARCRVVVTVSRDVEPYDLYAAEPWSRDAGIEWRWIDDEVWDAYGIYGTAAARFTYDFQAPFVVMLDADVLCTAPLIELPELVGDGLGGVMAWVTPLLEGPRFRDGRDRTAAQMWADLFQSAELPIPAVDQEHPAWRIMQDTLDHRYAPRYFNLGMLAGCPGVIRRVGSSVFADMERVARFVDTRFRCQLAISLASTRTGTPLVTLPLRWNCPNNPFLWDSYPEQHDVRILHYVETDEIDREALSTVADLEAIVTRENLSAPNQLLRDRLQQTAHAWRS